MQGFLLCQIDISAFSIVSIQEANTSIVRFTIRFILSLICAVRSASGASARLALLPWLAKHCTAT